MVDNEKKRGFGGMHWYSENGVVHNDDDEMDSVVVLYNRETGSYMNLPPDVADKISRALNEHDPDAPLRRTSDKWYEEMREQQRYRPEGVIEILDPDGWDRKNFDHSFYEEEITQEEFQRRLIMSTVKYKKPHKK